MHSTINQSIFYRAFHSGPPSQSALQDSEEQCIKYSETQGKAHSIQWYIATIQPRENISSGKPFFSGFSNFPSGCVSPGAWPGFRRLLDASGYKEKFREDMIRWGGEEERDPGYFCRLIVRDVPQPVWIVSDARRGSDVEWFRCRYQLQTRTVRVQASEESRRERGWVYTAGIDDAESECGLDQGVAFDWTISNDSDGPLLEEQLERVLRVVRDCLEL
ncbi:phosphomevalonate kinase [Acipenser oxyrinchus oxyrinchus]|uniref:Phosphomevalonate kinase n=1 Tax=Acipenser oxyrinchus oxyrinchus TaxID=40147 RepID=A0AAD8CGG8_ACIOX|nr:phosphomevalonate kinase [Acipenser oxyrinchus oxyrinchus]